MPVIADPMNRLEEARKQIELVAGAITDDQQHEDLMEARRSIDGGVDRQAGGDESSHVRGTPSVPPTTGPDRIRTDRSVTCCGRPEVSAIVYMSDVSLSYHFVLVWHGKHGGTSSGTDRPGSGG